MPILSREQLEKLAKIIRKHTAWLAWRLLGEEYISTEDLELLKREGVLPTDKSTPVIEHAFDLGRMESRMKRKDWKNYTWEKLDEETKREKTPSQRLHVKTAEMSAHTHLRGLEADIQKGLFNHLTQATRQAVTEAQIKGEVDKEIKDGVEANRNYKEVAKRLSELMQDTKRNWHRVASTEMHAARQNGVVDSILSGTDIYENADGEDSDVAVIPQDDACKDCKRMYLDESTGHPKIFKLSFLLKNAGTNYQKPWRQNARPVVPPLHSNCYCHIQYVSPGWGWDKKGRYTVVDKEKIKKSVEALRKSQLEEAHSLLSSMSQPVPTENDIKSITDQKEAKDVIEKIFQMKKLYTDNAHLFYRLEDLEKMAIIQLYTINGGSLGESHADRQNS